MEATKFNDIALKLIDAARLAPSSHNSQPWLYRIKDGSIEVWGNEKRRLIKSDPVDRQLFISLGCAIENIRLSADYHGLDTEISYFPDPQSRFFAARLECSERESRAPGGADHLFHSLAKRHANRGNLLQSPSLELFRAGLGKVEKDLNIRIDYIDGKKEMEEMAKIVADATHVAFKDEGFKKELGEWIKPSLKKYDDGMPGYNLEIPFPISFIVPFAIAHLDVANGQKKMVEKMLANCPAYLVVSADEDTALNWVRAGQAAERLWLEATRLELGMGPLAAAINIGDFYRGLQKVLNLSSRPLFFCRVGKPVSVPPKSPRLRMEKVVIK